MGSVILLFSFLSPPICFHGFFLSVKSLETCRRKPTQKLSFLLYPGEVKCSVGTYMAYCTVKSVSSDVLFPGDQFRTFLRFTEEKATLTGLGGEEHTEEEQMGGLRKRDKRHTINMSSCVSIECYHKNT